jgi:hypothetical protein
MFPGLVLIFYLCKLPAAVMNAAKFIGCFNQFWVFTIWVSRKSAHFLPIYIFSLHHPKNYSAYPKYGQAIRHALTEIEYVPKALLFILRK